MVPQCVNLLMFDNITIKETKACFQLPIILFFVISLRLLGFWKHINPTKLLWKHLRKEILQNVPSRTKTPWLVFRDMHN